ncbi:RDD family protein [Flavobacterium sp. ST-87]|uniref:RDD family protein n=1 Tax=Flavobacterium plantiphilum TaxID=3163297 RepID=A0ABW8XSZ6_9FLAO
MENEKFVITDNLQATQFQRFLNWFVDLIFIYILILSLGTTIILIALAVDNFELSNWVKNMSKSEIGVYSLIIAFLYYWLTEMYFSRTIAKLITHTIVVNSDGSKPAKKTFFIRSCCRFIPFEVFSFLGSVPRGWHDVFSKTYVVKKRELLNVRKNQNKLITDVM